MLRPDHEAPDNRAEMPIRVYRLSEEPRDDLTHVTTPEQRFDMVRELTVRMWTLSGRRTPAYDRSAMPVRVTTLA